MYRPSIYIWLCLLFLLLISFINVHDKSFFSISDEIKVLSIHDLLDISYFTRDSSV